MSGERATGRVVLQVNGQDREKFLNGLLTCDVPDGPGQLVYTALLTPQGKYLADFFATIMADSILLDCDAEQSAGVLQRLNMYKLRADVSIDATDITVCRGLGPIPDGAMADPRHSSLGWRAYGHTACEAPTIDWKEIRVAHAIPKSGVELIPNESFILECGFERLGGVDFKKGCYVGQEVTARMKHKTELRKGLVAVSVAGSAPVGTAILAGEKTVGTLFTQSGDKALAYLRFDRVQPEMKAGDAVVTANN